MVAPGSASDDPNTGDFDSIWEDLQLRSQGLQAERDELAAALVRESQLLASAQVEVTTLRQELVEGAAELSSLQSDIAVLQMSKQQMEESLQYLKTETDQLKKQLSVAETQSQERGVSIEKLQRQLQEISMQAAELRQALHPQELWQDWMEQEQQALIGHRARFDAEVAQHAAEMRELEVLRAECDRRYAMLQNSDQIQLEQAKQLHSLHIELLDLRQQLSTRPSHSLSTLPPGERQLLERQLKESRIEAELLLKQLKQVQEELEGHYLLSLNQSSAAQQTQPLQGRLALPLDADNINVFRQRLLASG